MANLRREIECLNRLQTLEGSFHDILNFLKQEKLVDDTYIKSFKYAADKPREMQEKLATLSREDKLQMLEYTWNILPMETICILIVTDRDRKEFTYNL